MSQPTKPKEYAEAVAQLPERFTTFSTPCVFCVRVMSSNRMIFAKAIRDIEKITTKEAAARVKACKESDSPYEIWIWNDNWNPGILYDEMKTAFQIAGALTLMGHECEVITKFDIEYVETDANIKRIWKER